MQQIFYFSILHAATCQKRDRLRDLPEHLYQVRMLGQTDVPTTSDGGQMTLTPTTDPHAVNLHVNDGVNDADAADGGRAATADGLTQASAATAAGGRAADPRAR
jgi:hypothetical protein